MSALIRFLQQVGQQRGVGIVDAAGHRCLRRKTGTRRNLCQHGPKNCARRAHRGEFATQAQGFDQAGFAQTRYTDQQGMAAGQEGGEAEVNDVGLTENDFP